MKQIPNLFTLLNLFFGCIAIVYALPGSTAYTTYEGEWFAYFVENLKLASLFICIAAVIDFLDGFVARALKASSEMGKQLDSLADIVSFGVAPAIILYQFLRIAHQQQLVGLDTSIIGLLPAFIYACAGGYRLARFNIDTEQSYGFKGVPIPAAGLLVASLPMIYSYNNETVNYILTNKWVLYGLIIFLSWLMVSKLPLMALKFKDFTLKNNMPKLILLVIAIIAALFFQWLAVPIVFVGYIILSLLQKERIIK